MIDRYKKFTENVSDEEEDDMNYDYDDDLYDDDYYGRHDYSKYDNEEDDDMESDMEHLKSLLLTMFTNKNIDNVNIANDGMDLSIRCSLENRERLSDIVSLFDLLNKLKTDILPQYDTEFDMWQNYSGQTFEFGFYYNEGSGDSEDNDYEEDDNKPF